LNELGGGFVTSRNSFLVFVALIASGSLIGACGDGQIADPRLSSDDELTPDQFGVDELAPDQFGVDELAPEQLGVDEPLPGVTGVPYGHVTPADAGVTIGVGVVGPVPTVEYTGSCTPAAGTTIENVVINNCGTLRIENPNITLRNVIATFNNSSFFGVFVDGRSGTGGDASGFTVEYSRIEQRNADGKLFGSFSSGPSNMGNHRNWTIKNSELIGGYDWHYIEGDLDGFLVENNYYHDLSADPASGVHADGFQISEANHTTGQMTIRGNYFDPNNSVGKTALLFSTGNDSINQTHILWESNFIPIWGAYTIWCADSDFCIARYNVYRQDFRTKLGNRTTRSGGESDSYPNCAYLVELENAPFTTYRCNRYEDGDFIENQWVCVEGGGKLTHDVSGCPSYP